MPKTVRYTYTIMPDGRVKISGERGQISILRRDQVERGLSMPNLPKDFEQKYRGALQALDAHARKVEVER